MANSVDKKGTKNLTGPFLENCRQLFPSDLFGCISDTFAGSNLIIVEIIFSPTDVIDFFISEAYFKFRKQS